MELFYDFLFLPNLKKRSREAASTYRKIVPFTMLLLRFSLGRVAARPLLTRTFVSRTIALYSKDLPYHIVVGLPSLSPTMDSGSLVQWYKKEGDPIIAGDAVAQIETDKASMDFEAQDDAFLAKILVQPGAGELKVGTPIMITVEEEADIEAFADFKVEDIVSSAEPTTSPTKEEPKSEPPKAKPTETAAKPPPVAQEAKGQSAPVSPPSPPPAAPAMASSQTTFAVAWGGPVTKGPLDATLSKQRQTYVAKYGTTGQVVG